MTTSSLVARNGTHATQPAASTLPAANGPLPGACVSAIPLLGARRRRFYWGIAGTVLSVIGFVAMIGIEQYSGMLSELRGDLKHFNETAGEYVKKENFHRLRDRFVACLAELEASKNARDRLEHELEASQRSREELGRALQQTRERLAFLEGKQAATPFGRLGTPSKK